jgi:hypothetical protein
MFYHLSCAPNPYSKLKLLSLSLKFFFGHTGIWTQDFVLAKASVLLLFILVILELGSWLFCPGCLDHNPPILGFLPSLQWQESATMPSFFHGDVVSWTFLSIDLELDPPHLNLPHNLEWQACATSLSYWLRWVLTNFFLLLGLASNYDPPNLSLPSTLNCFFMLSLESLFPFGHVSLLTVHYGGLFLVCSVFFKLWAHLSPYSLEPPGPVGRLFPLPALKYQPFRDSQLCVLTWTQGHTISPGISPLRPLRPELWFECGLCPPEPTLRFDCHCGGEGKGAQ